MSSEELFQIVQAVKAIHDTSTPNEKRIFYSKAIEELKAGDPAHSVVLAFQLILYNEGIVRHVGWNMIEYVIKYKWLQLSCDMREKIQNGILEHICQGQMYSMSPADLYLRTVMSRSVVQIMEEEWPQNWPQLLPQFRTVVSDPKLFPQSQMIFAILQRLIEDVVTYGTIDDSVQRRRLSTALSQALPQILEMTIERIRLCLTEMSTEQSILLAKSAIELLSEIVEWAVTKTLEEYVDALIDVVCAYLQTAEFGIYEEAARCLSKIASRKCLRTTETPIVVSMFRDQPMQQILTATSLASEVSSSSYEHYKYLKSLSNLLCSLGVHLAEIWSYIMKTPLNFSLYLSALAAFFVHPSLHIRSETAQVLSTFCAHERISTNTDFISCISALLPNVPRSMQKIGAPTGADTLTCHYSRMDYDCDEEFSRDFHQLRDRCTKLVRDATPCHHNTLMLIVAEWVEKRFSQPEIVEPTEWEAMKRFITAFLSSLYSQGVAGVEQKATIISLFDRILQRIVVMNPLTSANLINEMLSILSSFLTVLDACPDRIAHLLAHLKQLLLLPNENNDDMELTSLKRHCIALLLRITQSLSDNTKPYANAIFAVVNEAADHVSIMQRSYMIHVLGALSNFAETPEQQAAFLRNALDGTLQFFLVDAAKCTDSVDDFLAYAGLTEPAPGDPAMFQNMIHYQQRVALKAHLSTIEGLLGQVSRVSGGATDENGSDGGTAHPMFGILLPLIPKLFQLNQILNDMNLPENFAKIHPNYGQSVLELPAWERQQILSSSMSLMVASSGSQQGDESIGGALRESASQHAISAGSTQLHETPLGYMRRFVMEVNDFTPNLIGLLASRCSTEFYSLPQTEQYLLQSIHSLPVVPVFRLRNWLRRCWNRVASSCPAGKAHLLYSFSLTITKHFEQVCGAGWAAVEQINNETEAADGDDGVDHELMRAKEDEAVFADSLITLVSREYANFLLAIIVGDLNTPPGMRKDPSELISALGKALLASGHELLIAFVSGLVQLINWPDSQSTLKAITALNIVVSIFYANFDGQLSNSVLIECIKGLQKHGHDELLAGPLLNLIFNIYLLLRPMNPTFIDVLKQVPGSVLENIETFDARVVEMASNRAAQLSSFATTAAETVNAGDEATSGGKSAKQNLLPTEKSKRDLMRKVLKTMIATRPSEAFRQPRQHRGGGGQRRTDTRQEVSMVDAD